MRYDNKSAQYSLHVVTCIYLFAKTLHTLLRLVHCILLGIGLGSSPSLTLLYIVSIDLYAKH
jgi:hypothetical protein